MWVRRGSTNLMAGKVVFLRGLLSPIRVVDLTVMNPLRILFKVVRSGRRGDPEQRVRFPDGRFSGRRKRKKRPREMACTCFLKLTAPLRKNRNGFITVKSTTLIGLNSPRKNTTLPAIRFVEPRRTHIPV
ncbi:hypothetical protein TNCV_4664891 [Trichonephila clavipes]|uniref:Uncharacterized protein n=1 Tax=Trichonephila clavipes TaxID=2585209 RepID=A0A8X6RZJ2_TRICX|nr:hypothetical protein TNCV_4664891 [Trichonephila clavipes]